VFSSRVSFSALLSSDHLWSNLRQPVLGIHWHRSITLTWRRIFRARRSPFHSDLLPAFPCGRVSLFLLLCATSSPGYSSWKGPCFSWVMMLQPPSCPIRAELAFPVGSRGGFDRSFFALPLTSPESLAPFFPLQKPDAYQDSSLGSCSHDQGVISMTLLDFPLSQALVPLSFFFFFPLRVFPLRDRRGARCLSAPLTLVLVY